MSEAMFEGYLLDPLTQQEVNAACQAADHAGVDGAAAPETWTPSDDDEARVEGYLRDLRRRRAQVSAINADVDHELRRLRLAYEGEVGRLEEYRAGRLRRPTAAIGYLEHMLRLFSEAVGRTKRVSPHGTIRWRKGSQRVEIADPAAFCAQHGDDSPLVRVSREPSKSAIRNLVKFTGEVPAGAELVRGEDSFQVETPLLEVVDFAWGPEDEADELVDELEG